jgi:hypothetical protein
MLSGGNIQISGSNVSTIAVRQAGEQTIRSVQSKNTQFFDLKVYANPTSNSFGLQPMSSDKHTRMLLRITDVSGRVIAIYDQLKDSQNLIIGDAFDKGVYFAELIQGDQRKVIRLLKIK